MDRRGVVSFLLLALLVLPMAWANPPAATTTTTLSPTSALGPSANWTELAAGTLHGGVFDADNVTVARNVVAGSAEIPVFLANTSVTTGALSYSSATGGTADLTGHAGAPFGYFPTLVSNGSITATTTHAGALDATTGVFTGAVTASVNVASGSLVAGATTLTSVPSGFSLTSTSPATASHQGYATDGTFHYTIDDATVYKRNYTDWSVVTTYTNPRPSPDNGQDHMGDGDYYNGHLYVPIETSPNTSCNVDPTATKGSKYAIMSLNLTSGAVDQTFDVSSTPDVEVAGVAVDTDHNLLYMNGYCDGSTIWKLNLTTGAFVGSFALTQPSNGSNGLAYKNGLLYITQHVTSDCIIVSDLDGRSTCLFVPSGAGNNVEGPDFSQAEMRIEMDNPSSARNVYYFTPSTTASFATTKGRAGVNTLTPDQTLEVYTAGASGGILDRVDTGRQAQLILQSGTARARLYERDSDGTFAINVNDSDHFRIDGLTGDTRITPGGGSTAINLGNSTPINESVALEVHGSNSTMADILISNSCATCEVREDFRTPKNYVRWFLSASSDEFGLFYHNATMMRVKPNGGGVDNIYLEEQGSGHGNVSIGYSSSTAINLKLMVNGGVSANNVTWTNVTSEGTCDVSRDGALRLLNQGTSTDRDIPIWCLRNTNGTYQWHRIAEDTWSVIVTSGSTSAAVTFTVNEPDALYMPICTPSWNSGAGWWSSIATTGFTWNFPTAPSADTTLRCTIQR